jgi:hypothetical protein
MEISFKQTLFSIEPKNKRCIDCGEKNIAYVSVNNGITICELCAQIHRQLGPSISNIRKIDEEFDDYSMNFFIYGGNKNFKNTLKSLGVNLDMQRSKLYKTYGVDYYRKCLLAKVKGLENNEKKPNNPNELINPENKYEDNHNNDDNEKGKFKENKSSIHNINNFLNINNNAGNKTNVDEEDNGESHIQLNYQNNIKVIHNDEEKEKNFKKNLLKMSLNKVKSLGGYIRKNGAKSIEAIKKAGTIIAKKSKPAAENIKKTAKYVGEHIPYFHKHKIKSQEDIKNDDDLKEDNKNVINFDNKDNNEN